MTPTRIAFMTLAVLIALVGLFTAAAAREPHLSLFAWGLFVFGALFCLSLVKRTFDEAEGIVPGG
jgi:apolipoprotein N-acyltransferase